LILGDTMAGQGFHFSTYVTRISFDPNEAHPKMVFRPLQGLSDAEAPVILELRSDPTVNRITTGDIVLGNDSPSTPVASTTTHATAMASSTLQTDLGSAQPAINVGQEEPMPQIQAPTSTAIESVPSGFGGVTSLAAAREQGSQASSPAPAPVQQTISDTGEPETSDADLDMRIAGLIKGKD